MFNRAITIFLGKDNCHYTTKEKQTGTANEEWAYELFRSIQRIFMFLFLVYSVGKDNSFSVNVRW